MKNISKKDYKKILSIIDSKLEILNNNKSTLDHLSEINSYKEIRENINNKIQHYDDQSPNIKNIKEDLNGCSWKIIFDAKCEKDLKNWEKNDLNIYNKIQDLIEEIKFDPFNGIGRVEILKGDLEGLYSRRISKQNRLIYEIDGEKVFVKSCRGHYEQEKRKGNRMKVKT